MDLYIFEKYDVWVETIKKLQNHKVVMQSQTELVALEDELMAAEKPMSFASFAPDIQERFQRAVDYADMFVELKSHTFADSL